MEERYYLEQILNEIIDKLAWGGVDTWTNSNYKALSDRVYEKNKVLINPRTMRRIFDLLNGSSYNPHISTKDVLAQFLDYKDWDAYRAQVVLQQARQKTIVQPEGHPESPAPQTLHPPSKRSTNRFILLGAMLLVVAGSLYLIIRNQNLMPSFVENKARYPKVNINKQAGLEDLPVAVTLTFDSEINDTDQIFIQRDNGYSARISPIKTQGLVNLTYFLPGLYRLSLVNKKSDSVFYRQNVLVPSKGWTSVVGYNSEAANPFEYSNDVPERSGLLYLSPEKVRKYKDFDPQRIYYVTYRKFGHTGISGNDFRFKTRVVNNASMGGVTCFDNILIFRCEKDDIRLHFVEKGCQRFVKIKAAKSQIEGTTTDLKSFAVDIESGIDVLVNCSGNVLRTSINGKPALNMSFAGELGEILGIEYAFKGHGGIDSYLLESLTDTTRNDSENF